MLSVITKGITCQRLGLINRGERRSLVVMMAYRLRIWIWVCLGISVYLLTYALGSVASAQDVDRRQQQPCPLANVFRQNSTAAI